MASDTKAYASLPARPAPGLEPAFFRDDDLADGGAGPALRPAREISLAGAPALSEQIDRLFRAQAPRLMRFLARRTRRQEDAADILQDTFLRLTRLVATANLPIPAASPEAYLQQIATNLLRDRSRRRITHAEALHDPIDEHAIVDTGPGPADGLEARDLLKAYEDALAKLRPKTRRVFLLHRQEGLTYARIAAEVGISVSGVEKHMMTAIAHLDRAIERR